VDEDPGRVPSLTVVVADAYSAGGSEASTRRTRALLGGVSSGTERSRCGWSIQVVVFGYGVTMRARCPDKDHTDLSGAGRE